MRNKVLPNLPRSKAKQLIKTIGLSKEQSNKVRKHLILGNTVIDEVRVAHQEITRNRKGEVQTLGNIVSGKIVNKYRAKKWLSGVTGIGRRSLTCLNGKKSEAKKAYTRKRTRMVCEKEVQDFLERDDNSRCMPGEANVKKSQRISKGRQEY